MKYGFLLLVVGVFIGVGGTKMIDKPVNANSPVIVHDLFKPGSVFGVGHYVLEEGTDEKEFERFLSEEYFPTWNAAWEKAGTGIKGYLIKGERGSREGQYGLLMYFPDLETRNKYFPTTGSREEFEKFAAQVDMIPLAEFEGFKEFVELGDQIILPTK